MALNMLGQCHAHGWGVLVNPFMAAYWYRLSALAGLDWGMYNYATALALGQGIPVDRATALDWFRRAAALGHAKSLNMIGSFHEDGWVVERDLPAAADYYLRAARSGDLSRRVLHGPPAHRPGPDSGSTSVAGQDP
ncbi:Sel1 repeat family protein OS=Castellaniella defragrans OX=75697 GN=HNR28_002484 PE=4 SV=1 [Castellaniella defragrans]